MSQHRQPVELDYLVVIEQAYDAAGRPTNLGAYVPDLPGCAVLGDSVDEVRESIQIAIQLHLDGLLEDGMLIPPPSARAVTVRARLGA